MYTQPLEVGTTVSRKGDTTYHEIHIRAKASIGLEIYSKTITIYEAATKYDINLYIARDYMRLYRDKNGLPPMIDNEPNPQSQKQQKKKPTFVDYDDLENMSKDELIDEVIKARVEAERAKKGYTVKGSGQEKEFINLKNQNSK